MITPHHRRMNKYAHRITQKVTRGILIKPCTQEPKK